MNKKTFFPRLFNLVILLWIGSYVLNQDGAYKMVQVNRRLDKFISSGNWTLAAMQEARNDVYDLSRVLGVWGNVIFSVGTGYISWHSFKYMDDILPKLQNFCANIFFLLGLVIDATGIGLLATGFSKYGGANVQDGTAYHTSGLVGVLIGSILIIYDGYHQEETAKKLAKIKMAQNGGTVKSKTETEPAEDQEDQDIEQQIEKQVGVAEFKVGNGTGSGTENLFAAHV